MSPKRSGACSKCDEDVFDVLQDAPLPRKIGAPHDDAMRATFFLVDSTQMDLTFCKNCLDTLTTEDYPWLWKRVQLSWEVESPGHPNQKQHARNGIMALAHAQPWKEVQ